jgi:kynurenine formamidase
MGSMDTTSDSRWRCRPEPSNWGDFGQDDQIGRLNLITPALVLSAVAEVRAGKSFCLSLPLDYPGGTVLSSFRRPPDLQPEVLPDGRPTFNVATRDTVPLTTDVFSDQRVSLSLQYSTHWDGLAHVGQIFDVDGSGEARATYYNGFDAEADVAAVNRPPKRLGGARRLGIEHMASACVQGRGVMIDVKAHFGRSGKLIGYEELMLILERDRVVVRPGDFVCLRTGFAELLLEMQLEPNRAILANTTSALDGRDARLQKWITDTGIVAIAADNYAVEALPAPLVPHKCCASLPLHEHCLFRLGVYLGEMWYLGELADWLRGAGRSAFLLTAPPLRLPGAVASPTSPIATV